MIVVGLTGYARSGKNSVADILVRDHGFTQMSFAAPVKQMVRSLNPIVGYRQPDCDCGCCPVIEPVLLSDLIDDYDMTDDEIKESAYGDEVRRLWQRFATECFRAEDPSFWIDLAEEDLMESKAERVVFTDCRFPNEAVWLDQLSYAPFITSSIWQVARPGHEADPEGHESEKYVGLLGEEITIHNDGSLEELAEPVNLALEFTKLNEQPQLPLGAEFMKGLL